MRILTQCRGNKANLG